MRRNLLQRFTLAYRCTHLWNKAEDAGIAGNYVRALEHITKLYRLFSDDIPSNGPPYGVNALCARIAANFGDYRLSISASRMCMQQIANDPSLSTADKDYLNYYCKVNLLYCADQLNDAGVYREAMATPVEFDARWRETVKRHIMRNFPVRKI
jgi:hypothetical protein